MNYLWKKKDTYTSVVFGANIWKIDAKPLLQSSSSMHFNP